MKERDMSYYQYVCEVVNMCVAYVLWIENIHEVKQDNIIVLFL